MNVISKEQRLKTYVNVFTCKPENQQALSEAIRKETEEIVRHMPGFVSANVHCSTDGTRVTNYAQWNDLAVFEKHIRSEAGRAMITELHKYADDADVHVYEVDWTLAGEENTMRSAREIWEEFYEAIDAGDGETMVRLCSPDIEIQTASRESNDPEKLVDLFGRHRNSYDEPERVVDSLIESADGKALSAELTLSGIPKGAKERLTWRVVETVRVEDGRIVSWHSMLDRSALIEQFKALQQR
jgi:ketosteroid isomerase-like protein/quinol monooxygenase YgiN